MARKPVSSSSDRWVSLREIADHLGLSKEKIYQMARTGEIPCSRIGNRWRFKKQVVDDWMITQGSTKRHRGSERGST